LLSIDRRLIVVVVAASLVAGIIGLRAWHAADAIRIGAVFPLDGNAASLARQQELGVQIARDLVNADGGIDGRPVELEVRDLERGQDATAVMASLRTSGVQVVIGAYASDLSIAASAAAARAGLVYWEAGAVADRLTGRGYPQVFRVGASGSNLGSNSARFAATQLASKLGKPTSQMRLAIVAADDEYARSVADAAKATAGAAGMPLVARLTYDLAVPRWPALMVELADARPDVIVLASHIPDGIAFRRAMLQAGLKVGALIGSTMAECSPDFAGDLGPDAVGIFASDRPTGGFQASALGLAARTIYARFAAAWATARAPASAGAPPNGSEEEYPLQGPVQETAAGPTEEGLSGFTAGWALLHDVLPLAAHSGDLRAGSIAAAARLVDLPTGSLPNGAGLRFSSATATLGQNERAAAVIWQWQAVRTYAFVWPSTYATNEIGFVPLAR
jgi:branched-chain amino acid transport system substrate-binding protein